MKNQLKIVNKFMKLPQNNINLLKTLHKFSSYLIGSRKLHFSASLCCNGEKISSGNSAKKLPKISIKDECKNTIEEKEPVLTEREKEIINLLKQKISFYPYNSPFERAKEIFKEDIKLTCRNAVYCTTGIKLGNLELNYFPKSTDILIIGSGIVGLSTAYAIKSQFPHGFDIIVVDKNENINTTISLASGTLTHQNHSQEIEIQMSKYCAEFLNSFSRLMMMPKHAGFNLKYDPLGTLVLADENSGEGALNSLHLQEKQNVSPLLLEPSNLKEMFPWLKTDDCLFATLGSVNEGLFDPFQVMEIIKGKLINLGVKFVTAEVIDFGVDDNRINRVVCKLPNETYNSIDFGYCIMAAGTGSIKLINLINNMDHAYLKMRFPIEKKKIYEYCFYNFDGPGLNTPIIINPDGVNFRREGVSGLYVVGVPCITDEKLDVYEVFETKVKPFLCTRFDHFKELELRHGWIEEYTTNKCNDIGIIGPHPTNNEIYFAIGFTKCGFLFGPAVGRAIMEHLIYGEYKTIDFTMFHPENLYLQQHLEAEYKNKFLEMQKLKSISEC